jgi:hypothetical protein
VNDIEDAVAAAVDEALGSEPDDLVEESDPTPVPDLQAGELEVNRTFPSRYG